MTRFTIHPLTVFMFAAPWLALPASASGQAVPPTCPPEEAALVSDVEILDHILIRQTSDLPEVSRVAAEDLAEVAVPSLEPVASRPLPRDRHSWQTDLERVQLAKGTLTVQQVFAEREDIHRLVPR